MDRLFNCTHMDRGSTKQMEDICRKHCYSYSRRNSIRFMENCAISIQSADLISRGTEHTTLSTYTMLEEPKHFYRSHPAWLQQRLTYPQTTWKSDTCKLRVNNLQNTSHKDFPSWRVSSLLCEVGTTNFLRTRNKEFNGETKGYTHQFSQDTATLHQKEKSSQSGSIITAIHASLSKSASDDSTFKSSLHEIAYLSTAHKASSWCAITPYRTSTTAILEFRNEKLCENSH